MPLNDYSVGIDVTDHGVSTANSAAVNQAALLTLLDGPYIAKIRNDFSSLPTLIFPAADTRYLFTGQIDVYGSVRLQGGAVSSRLGVSSVKLEFESGAYAFRFMSSEVNDPLPGAFWAEVRDMWLEPVNAGGVDIGILHHTPMRFENVVCNQFKKAGFIGAGSSSGTVVVPSQDEVNGVSASRGNTNTSVYMSCAARNTQEGHGFVASGNEAGIMQYLFCDAKLNNGCGFYDNDTIGCVYWGCHTAQNSWKVLHNGIYYTSIYPHISAAISEPGVGADWKRYWVPITATVTDAVWAPGIFFRATGGYNVIDTAAANFYIAGCYSEAGIEMGLVPRGTGWGSGGNLWTGRAYVDGPEAGQFNSPQSVPKWKGKNDTHSWGSGLGDTRTAAGNVYSCGHTDDADVNPATPAKGGVKLAYSTARHAYEWVKGLSTRMAAFTATGWTTTEGYSGGGHVLFEGGFIIGGPGGRRQRIRCAPSITTIPAGTALIKGEILSFTLAEAPGDAVMGKVTKGGTVGSGGTTEPTVAPFCTI